jgi:hypothetical protein
LKLKEKSKIRLNALLMDEVNLLPIVVVWKSLDYDQRKTAFRMLGEGNLTARGRDKIMDYTWIDSGFGTVYDIPIEFWLDADTDAGDWESYISQNEESDISQDEESDISQDEELTLQGPHPEKVIAEIKLYNSPKLREFVEFEKPSISVDEYDERFLSANKNKMGTKVWACAAAALASEKVEPTAKKMAKYLLDAEDIWPSSGPCGKRQIERNLSPFLLEFKRLRAEA